MAKLAEVWPSVTVTEPGGEAAALSLDSATVTPPVPATPDSVMVPVADVPPGTELGLITRLTGTAAVTVRSAVDEESRNVPVKVTVVSEPTVDVLTWKLPCV
jgi:hypothetical protein